MAKKKVKVVREKKSVWHGFQLAGLAATVMVMGFVVMGMASNSVSVGRASVEAASMKSRMVVPTEARVPGSKVMGNPRVSPAVCLDTKRVCAANCPMKETAKGCECVCQ